MQFFGNKKAFDFLQKVIEKNSIAGAYLFCGPENVGKFLLAKAFARSLILGENLSLTRDLKNALLGDLIVLSPEIEEKKGIIKEKEISAEMVRRSCRELAFFPINGKRKVLIVDNAHKMNLTAQNAFLKNLEEPNSTSVIILITHEDSKILPTIKSRCQKINFTLVENVQLGSEGEGQDFLMGRPGLSEQNLTVDAYNKACGALKEIFQMDLNQRISHAQEMSKNIPQALFFLNVWIWQLRKEAIKNEGQQLISHYSKIFAIDRVIHTLKNSNVNARLVLENLLIDF